MQRLFGVEIKFGREIADDFFVERSTRDTGENKENNGKARIKRRR